nr:hypothetical protein [Tanacetum cinerariifolium]
NVGVAVDSLESLKQTHARETAKLAALTCAIAESLAGYHEKERHQRNESIAEEEGLLKFLRNRCDDLRRKNARCRVLIHEMEALKERRVAVDSLESLKQTHARETAKLAALTGAIAESLAGYHEKERHVKEYQEKDKIESKPDKNEKRGEAGKSQKQLQSVEEVKLKKMQKEGSKMQTPIKFIRRKKRTRTAFAISRKFKYEGQIYLHCKVVCTKDLHCN